MGIRGRTAAGKVELDQPLPDGLEVDVNLRDDREDQGIDEELDAEILESIRELERGEGIPAAEVLDCPDED